MASHSNLSILLALSLCLAVNAMPAWYDCNPTNCATPNCMCASSSPPGGLAAADTPQFILLTHDDAINALADKVIRSITDQHTNPNGCNVPATWFTLQTGTDCTLTRRLYDQNHEIALHTVNHVGLYNGFEGDLQEEMFGVRTWLNKTCDIPTSDMIGYRNPYLVHNPDTRKTQAANGMLYDSTMISVFQNDSEIEVGPGMRTWPFSMDHGIPLNCNWNSPDAQCNGTTERYPGMWEVPLWELQNAAGDHLYSMDVGTNPPGDIYSILVENFNMNYLNNRTPLGIYLHATWFDTAGANAAALNKFMTWAMAQPNVWAATSTQVVRWMQNPVPASQMNDWFKCNPVDLSVVLGDVKCQLYSVQGGDSSYTVATKFAVTVEELASVNAETNIDTLVPGQKLRIPTWDETCVGDAVKNVTGPGQVQASTDTGTAATHAPDVGPVPAGPEVITFDIVNPTSGVNITMRLSGRTQLAFQTDLKIPFTSELARALSVVPQTVTLLSVVPENTLAGRRRRRLAQASGDASAPVVEVLYRVGSQNPTELYDNATTILAMGGPFDTNVLPNYQLKMVAETKLSAFKDNQIYDTTAELSSGSGGGGGSGSGGSGSVGTTSNGGGSGGDSSSSSSSSLSSGAIAGIVIGSLLGVALIAAVAVVVVRKRRAAAAASESPVASTNSDGKFSAGSNTIKKLEEEEEDVFQDV